MNRPKIDIERSVFDWFIEVLTAGFITLSIVFVAIHFGELPETIPSHYNAAGEPDGFSGKRAIWILPLISLAQAVGFFILNRFPHIFNYPVNYRGKC